MVFKTKKRGKLTRYRTRKFQRGGFMTLGYIAGKEIQKNLKKSKERKAAAAAAMEPEKPPVVRSKKNTIIPGGKKKSHNIRVDSAGEEYLTNNSKLVYLFFLCF